MSTQTTGKQRSTKSEILCNLPKYPHFAKVKEIAFDARCDERAARICLVQWSHAGKVHMRPSIHGDMACISAKWWKRLTAVADAYFELRYPVEC